MTFLAAFEWDCDPQIFKIGVVALRWYGLLFATAFVLGFFLMRGIYRREGKKESDLDSLLTWMVVATIIGARLGHCLFYEPAYYLSHPEKIIAVWEGGLASHGGAIGILIALWLYTRTRPDQPYLWLLDRIVLPTALAGCFIRLGNFFNSEIVGVHTDRSWGVIFRRLHDPEPRHPAQLYESVCYLLVFFLLWAIYRSRGAATPRGRLLGLFLVLVFGARFAIEFVKKRQAAWGEDLPLSVGQLLSIPVFALGVYILARSRAPEATT
ncbi:MAG: prolipoprotein diacylglyceryl transferase [Planctomycetota bacterium]